MYNIDYDIHIITYVFINATIRYVLRNFANYITKRNSLLVK
jgi:hypothetical protein